jgi:hypothetical protein
MFCAKCGNDVGDGSAGACARCGAQLPAARPAQQAQGQPAPGYGAPGQQQAPGYGAPPQGQQYGAPPGGQQQYGAPAGGQQYGAPAGGQQYGAPPQGQQYSAPSGGQQPYGGPPPGQQYGGPAQGQPTPGQPGPAQPAPGWAPGSGSRTPSFAFDAKRWTPGEITVGVASLVVLISLFLPWFNASVTGLGSGSESGMDAHGWLWIVFIVVLAILAFLVVKAGFGDLPFTLPLQEELILLGATGLDLLLVLIGFLLKPTAPAEFGVHVSIGWDIGSFLGLIAAIVAVAPLVPAARNLGSAARKQ